MKDNKITYVGIAKNLNARKSQHLKKKIFEQMISLTDTPLHRGEARSVEQALIHNNPHFENIINSIAEDRALYKDAVSFGEKWLTDNGHAIKY